MRYYVYSNTNIFHFYSKTTNTSRDRGADFTRPQNAYHASVYVCVHLCVGHSCLNTIHTLALSMLILLTAILIYVRKNEQRNIHIKSVSKSLRNK